MSNRVKLIAVLVIIGVLVLVGFTGYREFFSSELRAFKKDSITAYENNKGRFEDVVSFINDKASKMEKNNEFYIENAQYITIINVKDSENETKTLEIDNATIRSHISSLLSSLKIKTIVYDRRNIYFQFSTGAETDRNYLIFSPTGEKPLVQKTDDVYDIYTKHIEGKWYFLHKKVRK